MSCHGGFSLDEATRRTWYNPEVILKEAGLDTGMVFMDIGCGNGFFTLLAAITIGKSGIVYAVDSDAKAIEQLKAKAKTQRLKNVRAKAWLAEETVFCTACADIVFYSMVLHDFKDPGRVLQNAKKMLKPAGKLVNLDWKKMQVPFGPPFKIRFSEQEARELLKMAGFSITDVKEAGPYHYVVTAKPIDHC
jgi:ubiquinone/menaquinone biosynthesis C-methylase UbiE